MGRKINLSGQQFGLLTVIEEYGRNKGNHILWKCQCQCGNYHITSRYSLTSGLTRSCGCLRRKRNREKLINVKGEIFDRLTVIKQVNSSKHGEAMWECRCVCGTIKNVSGSSLRKGHTRSCGCLRRENLKQIHKNAKKYAETIK